MFLWFHTHWHEGPSSRRATDLYLISHVRSHGGAFLLPVFFFFFLRKESLSLLCGWQAQAIYIYISAISLLSSFILLLHFFSISSHLPSTIPSLSVSLPLFFSPGIHFLYIRVPFFFFYFLPLCHLSLSVFPAFSLPCGHAGSFSWSARTL